MEGHRIGLIGCGAWGRHILRDLLSLGCEVAVVARSEANRRHATEAGAAAVVGSVGELPPVEGVVVATPNATHAAVVEAVLPLGVPVFVEKPFTVDAAAAERLAQAAPDRIFVMDKWRYHPGVEALARIARSGELGPVVGLRTTRVGWGEPRDRDVIWHLAPHDLSIALEVLGTIPEPRAAVADRRGGAPPAGLLGVLGGEPWLVLEVSARSAERRRRVTLHCRDGVAVLADGYADHVTVLRHRDLAGPEAAEERRPISTELPLYRELATFVQHLEGGPPPRSSAAEGAAVVRTIAVLRSLVGLPPDGG